MIDSLRFMSTLSSILVDTLSEGFHNDKCTDCRSYHDYMLIKDDQLIVRCFRCKINYKKDFNKNLIKRFANIYEYYDECDEFYINNFFLLLRKAVYVYEFMDCWKRFDETSLPDKEEFYSSLNMKEITGVDYRHVKRVFKYFNIKI